MPKNYLTQDRMISLVEAGDHFFNHSQMMRAQVEALSVAVNRSQMTFEEAFREIYRLLTTIKREDLDAVNIIVREKTYFNPTKIKQNEHMRQAARLKRAIDIDRRGEAQELRETSEYEKYFASSNPSDISDPPDSLPTGQAQNLQAQNSAEEYTREQYEHDRAQRQARGYQRPTFNNVQKRKEISLTTIAEKLIAQHKNEPFTKFHIGGVIAEFFNLEDPKEIYKIISQLISNNFITPIDHTNEMFVITENKKDHFDA